MSNDHYDVIVIGSGAGGGTLAHRLAPAGKRVLLLERGGYLPRERDNWDSGEVFVRGKYLRARVLVRPARQRVPAGGQLLRRRQHQVLRRGPVPAAARGLRRAEAPRRRLAGLADRLRRPRAVLHPGRAPLPGARAARRGPVRGPVQRRLRAPPGAARGTDPAAVRRPREAGPAPLPPADRGQPGAGRERTGDAGQRVHPLRPGRRLPVPCAGQVRLPGHLRRPGRRERRRRAPHRRLRRAARDRPGGRQRHRRRRPPRRRHRIPSPSARTSSWSPAVP